MHTPDNPFNHGVRLGRRPGDYVHGLVGALSYEIRNPSGDWSKFLPNGERQSNRRTETMACVSYSLLNVLETQAKFFGHDINFSDRFLAKMSGTTLAGNYLWAVADTVRKTGLVQQDVWPEPQDYTWDSYYADIPLEVRLKGKEFLANWTIAYEWIDITPASLFKHLKHAPLQVVIPGHAIECFATIVGISGSTVLYFDTYDPFIKSTSVQALSDAFKVIITPKYMPQIKTQSKNGELRIVLQASTMEEWKALTKVYGLNPDHIDEVIPNS